MHAQLCLLVLRVADLARAERFYRTLGFVFAREQHGSGPVHLAADSKGFVLELYPASERYPVVAQRLGFCVEGEISGVLASLLEAGGELLARPEHASASEAAWVLLADPDGHRLELRQQS